MALEFKKGTYKITSAKDLEKAAGLLGEIQDDEDYQEMKAQEEALKRAISHFMSSNDIVRSNGYTLVRAHDKVWITTDAEMPEKANKEMKSLQALIGDKVVKRKGKKPMRLFNFVTKRVVDRDKLDLAVKRGYVTLDEIAPALYQTPKAAYIRRSGNGGDDDE